MKNYEADALIFSCLSGYNVYVPSESNKKSKQSAFTYETNADGEILPIRLLHVGSDTEVAVHPVVGRPDGEQVEKWRYFVEQPIDVRFMMWPIDYVKLDDTHVGLVFPLRVHTEMESLKKLVYREQELDFRDGGIRSVLYHLLRTFSHLHRNGYAYHAFNVERIYYSASTGEILLDFSIAMMHYGQGESQNAKTEASAMRPEFLPPWIDFENRADAVLDMNDDLYSLAALLFRLMTGRMPYQGRLMDGYGDILDEVRDTDPITHMQMFAHYHEIPWFIFDPEDSRNSIGLYMHEAVYAERWEALPQTIKEMFLHTFSRQVLREDKSQRRLYSADEWMAALAREGILPDTFDAD